MRRQIRRLSPHQNAKVIAVLTALGSLLFVIPMFILFTVVGVGDNPQAKAHGPSSHFMLLFPIFYLILGYPSVLVSCWMYNTMFKWLGGIEFDDGLNNAPDQGVQGPPAAPAPLTPDGNK